MKHRSIASLAFACALAACSTATGGADMAPSPVTSVVALDVTRYMGVWWEIAKFPNWFQRRCVSDTRAEYRPRPDGQVEVINRCLARDGETLEAVGAARRPDPSKPSQFEVRFAPEWLAVVPLLWADYWVIDIDDRYQLAAVSEPRRKYLWILSRTPQVDAAAYEALLGRLAARGFDLARLERTPTTSDGARRSLP